MSKSMHDGIAAGAVFGRLTILACDTPQAGYCLCKCACGNTSHPTKANLSRGLSKSCGHCGRNHYTRLPDQRSLAVATTNRHVFYIDAEDEQRTRQHIWYCGTSQAGYAAVYNRHGVLLSRHLTHPAKGMEVDHIDLDPLNNRRCNLRICTHQQNQCNQPLQANNTSGVSGVSFYPPRGKYRARVKASQLDIHLGYFSSFEEAVQARNEGIKLMFGEYARINDASEPPGWIKQQVYEKCSRFREKAAVSF